MNTILILREKINKLILPLAIFLLAFFSYQTASAQESLTLSISPSLFDMSVEPGQEWQSSLKIINVNNYDLTVYLDVVNFSPQGEGGEGKFKAVTDEEANGSTLAEWFTITKEPVTIPREQSLAIPLSVKVPFDASPGGHFAAILVGTKPILPEQGQARVQTSQMVTSLFFARVAGDITEFGNIREFTTTDTYLNHPEVTFELRFENKGNVHLQPQGEIRITNMWGQERGIIPINQGSQFGNVLPESIRKFTFSWRGEWSVADIGRYTAVATLAYGTEERRFTSAETNFWVIPYKLLLGIFAGLAILISLLTWLVRLYVRHMLVLAGIDVNEYKKTSINLKKERQKVKLQAPVQAGILDLKQKLQASVSLQSRLRVVFDFCIKNRLFLIAVIITLTLLFMAIWYVMNANTAQRSYEVTYVNSDANVKLNSEEIIYNQLKAEMDNSEIKVNERLPKLKIVNRSGDSGLGAKAKLRLEKLGYEVAKLEVDSSSSQLKSVIVYSVEEERFALKLSSELNNALVSVSEDDQTEKIITIFVGRDIEKE